MKGSHEIMTLRRAAFPERVGSRIFTVYLLWLEAADISDEGGPRPVLAAQPEELEQVVQDTSFQEALSQLPSGMKVEIVPSVENRFYVRVLVPPVSKAASQAVIPLPLCAATT